jgi:phosphopantothenoylcysteine decarboxylase/phosphopantothenate--cysteine ligase
VDTAAQMLDAVLAAYEGADAVVATAAVADLRPVTAAKHKQKKGAAPLTLKLERTTDILAELGAAKGERLLIGFAAETRDVLESAAAKLAAKHLDLVVANDVSEAGLGFGSENNRVWLVSADETVTLPVLSKTTIARTLWDRVAARARDAATKRGGTEGNAS